MAASIGGGPSKARKDTAIFSRTLLDEGQVGDAEANDSDDDDGSDETDIQSLESFISQSSAFRDFKASLVRLTGLVGEVDRKNGIVDVAEMAGQRLPVDGIP